MKKFVSVYKHLWSYLKPYWVLELGAFFLTIIATVAVIQYSWIIKDLIDNVLTPKRLDKLLPVSALLVTIVILSIIAGLLKSFLFSLVSQKITVDIKTQLYNHILSLPHSFFVKTSTGDIISRISSDVENVQDVASNAIVDIITSLVTLIGVTAWIFFVNWRLTLVILAVIPLFIIISTYLNRQLWERSKKIQEIKAEVTGIIHETTTGMELIKTFTSEGFFKRKFSTKLKELSNNIIKLSIRANIANSLGQVILAPYQVILFGIAGYWYITTGSPSIGTLFAFLNFMGMLVPAAMTLLGVVSRMVQALASYDRIFEYVSIPVEESGNVHLSNKMNGEITFHKVSFSYDGKNFIEVENLKIQKGEIVALVGPTGAGKTTIMRLLFGLYKPQSGQITIDGIDIQSINSESLRKHIGVVSQEVFLFNTSIRENLLLARPESSMEEIIEATRKAQIHDFINCLPQGYDTVIGERGIALSGGERQRISIARTILKNPDLLILDEPTSSVDNLTEKALMNVINDHFKGKTVLIIAHRLSTIHMVNKIVVINKGTVVQVGGLDELMQKKGLFADLYQETLLADTIEG